MYKLIITRRFERDFKKHTSHTKERAIFALKRLLKDPFKIANKLIGVKRGKYRIRIGDFRIRFDVEKKDIVLYSFLHRKDAYKH